MKKFYKKNDNEDIIAASDAFFPFVDGIEKLAQAGVTAIVQPLVQLEIKRLLNLLMIWI